MQREKRDRDRPYCGDDTGRPQIERVQAALSRAPDEGQSPEEFQLWMSAFKRFYDASSLANHNVATQQGYLLQAVNMDLGKVVEHKITPSMKVLGPGGCLEVLEVEFRIIYPIFLRCVDFFLVKQDPREDLAEYLLHLSTMSDMADLEAMSKEDLTAFSFIASCTDKRLHDKLFKLKRKDMTTIN